MNVQVHHVVVHTPEQTAEILRKAMEITEELGPDPLDRAIVFQEACRLLGQAFSVAIPAEQVPMPLPAMAIPRGRR